VSLSSTNRMSIGSTVFAEFSRVTNKQTDGQTDRQTDTHTDTCRPVDGTSMNEECEAVMVDRQVCAVRFLT